MEGRRGARKRIFLPSFLFLSREKDGKKGRGEITPPLSLPPSPLFFIPLQSIPSTPSLRLFPIIQRYAVISPFSHARTTLLLPPATPAPLITNMSPGHNEPRFAPRPPSLDGRMWAAGKSHQSDRMPRAKQPKGTSEKV